MIVVKYIVGILLSIPVIMFIAFCITLNFLIIITFLALRPLFWLYIVDKMKGFEHTKGKSIFYKIQTIYQTKKEIKGLNWMELENKQL